MADIFDELLGPNGAPPQELIAALRRQRSLGQIGALSGDKNIRQLGGAEYDDALKQANGVRDRRDQDAARADQRAFALQQQQMASDDRKAQRDYQYAALKQAARLAREQNENALAVARLREAADMARAGSAGARARDQQMNKLEAAMRTSGIAAVWSAVKDAQDVVNEYTVKDKAGNVIGYKGVPGVGGLTNNRTWGMGTAATWLGNWGKEEDGKTDTATKGKSNQAKIASLQNLTAKARSGQAVTDQELNRLLAEAGLTMWSSDEDFLRAFPALMGKAEQAVRDTAAGYDPDVVEEYLRRGGLPGFSTGRARNKDAEIEDVVYREQQ